MLTIRFGRTEVIDFWKRWHITLNRFLTSNIYIPLGGSRKGRMTTYRNLLLIFLISGVWHGAGWNFIVWGLLHGVCYCLTKACLPVIQKIPRMITGFATFLFVNVAWIYFRAESVWQANQMLRSVFSFRFGKVCKEMGTFFNLEEIWYPIKVLGLANAPNSNFYGMYLFLGVSIFLIGCKKNSQMIANENKPRVLSAIGISILFLWAVVSFGEVSTFLYFNF